MRWKIKMKHIRLFNGMRFLTLPIFLCMQLNEHICSPLIDLIFDSVHRAPCLHRSNEHVLNQKRGNNGRWQAFGSKVAEKSNTSMAPGRFKYLPLLLMLRSTYRTTMLGICTLTYFAFKMIMKQWWQNCTRTQQQEYIVYIRSYRDHE